MPHVIRRGRVDLDAVWHSLPSGPWRWGGAVGRVEGRYLSADRHALLAAGVVVEYGRPLHPVILISLRGDETAVHLWPAAAVERTEAVKRLLVEVARGLDAFGAGEITSTNLAELI